MDFYISWSHSDAYYCDYFSDCPMLISAVPGKYRPLFKFRSSPSKLIVDSGALYYGAQDRPPTTLEIFKKQLEILEGADDSLPIVLVQVDTPMINRNTLSEKYEAMERTLFNAYEYLNLFVKANLPVQVEPMGAIQGFAFLCFFFFVLVFLLLGFFCFG